MVFSFLKKRACGVILTESNKEYSIVDSLGEGGCGKVFLAKRNDEEVAVKLLKADSCLGKDANEVFSKEMAVQAKLTQISRVCFIEFIERVVNVSIQGFEPNTPAFITEYIPQEMQKIGKENPKFWRKHIKELLQIAMQITYGLERMHGTGLVWGDMKPANIFITSFGTQNGEIGVKLGDFGLTRNIGERTRIDHEKLLGSVKYMSPAQLEGRALSPESDLYSLGVLLYLSPYIPAEIGSKNECEIKTWQLERKTQLITAFPKISQNLNDFIMQAVSSFDSERFKSAREFRESLEKVIKSEV